MKMIERLFFIILFALTSQNLLAQISAPDLYCIKGDTVRWDLPVVTCGPVQSYNLYYATSYNGPYSLLANITDINQTEYIYSNSPGGILYYYMETVASCGGMTSLSSDTLDNASPLPVSIRNVTVVGNDIDLNWSKGLSPETAAYIVYQGLGGGVVVALDTVSILNYIDTNKSTSDTSYTYYIVALDRCGGTSIFSEPHSSLLLKGVIDTCQQEIDLSFNNYNGWAGKTQYILLQSIDGGTEIPIDTTMNPGFVLTEILDDVDYCFRIKAMNEDGSLSSFSNKVCLHSKKGKTLHSICIDQIKSESGTNGEKTGIQLTTNDNILLNNILLQRAKDKLTIANSQEQQLEAPFDNFVSIDRDKEVTFYRMISVDACGNRVYSGIFNNLILDARLNLDNTVDINWNALDWEDGNVMGYRVERISANGNAEQLATLSEDVLSYTDHLMVGKDNDTRYCYRVTGTIDLTCNNITHTINVNSNEACVEKTAGGYMANAFVQGGSFPEYMPIFYFKESIAAYKMIIFDRYGNKVFQTNNPDKGWDGNFSGQPLPNGVYSYYVSIKSGNGTEQILKGGVTLLR